MRPHGANVLWSSWGFLIALPLSWSPRTVPPAEAPGVLQEEKNLSGWVVLWRTTNYSCTLQSTSKLCPLVRGHDDTPEKRTKKLATRRQSEVSWKIITARRVRRPEESWLGLLFPKCTQSLCYFPSPTQTNKPNTPMVLEFGVWEFLLQLLHLRKRSL